MAVNAAKDGRVNKAGLVYDRTCRVANPVVASDNLPLHRVGHGVDGSDDARNLYVLN